MRFLPCFLLALLLAPAQAAQSGPWTDGELLIRSVGSAPGSQVQTLYRVVPETGHGEILIDGFFYHGWAGGVAFDSYRDGVLINMGIQPSIFTKRLFLVDWDGSLSAIPALDDEWLRAITPIGDGRVYFQRDNVQSTEIQYLDAADAVHTLMDDTGLLPLSFRVEHMLYHAPTNSLLATRSASWSSATCAPGESSFYRIPLSVDGTQVAGPIVCGSVPGISNEIMSLDYLPGGDVLVQLAGSQFYSDTMHRLDVASLTTTIFASPSMADINGAYWSARIDRAVLLDDTSNVLRTYSEGQTGLGVELTADVVISPNTTGFSPSESFTEIDVFGPTCAGTTLPFGTGLAGSGGLAPALTAGPCPDVGNPFTVRADDVLGAAPGVLLAGFSETALPLAGGTLYVFPIAQTIPVVAAGTAGVAGGGTYLLPLTFTGPSFAGVNLFLQTVFLDAGAVFGYSISNGLKIAVG